MVRRVINTFVEFDWNSWIIFSFRITLLLNPPTRKISTNINSSAEGEGREKERTERENQRRRGERYNPLCNLVVGAEPVRTTRWNRWDQRIGSPLLRVVSKVSSYRMLLEYWEISR